MPAGLGAPPAARRAAPAASREVAVPGRGGGFVAAAADDHVELRPAGQVHRALGLGATELDVGLVGVHAGDVGLGGDRRV